MKTIIIRYSYSGRDASYLSIAKPRVYFVPQHFKAKSILRTSALQSQEYTSYLNIARPRVNFGPKNRKARSILLTPALQSQEKT
nr:hypothetical protein [Bacteroidota bacterium]